MSEERRPRVDHDTPPFSRLFVICSKNHEEDDIRRAFEEYGTVCFSIVYYLDVFKCDTSQLLLQFHQNAQKSTINNYFLL